MPLSYLYVYDLCFSISRPSGGDVSAKVRKFFIPASDPKKFFFCDPLAPTSAGAPQERTPLGFASAKIQLFSFLASPVPIIPQRNLTLP